MYQWGVGADIGADVYLSMKVESMVTNDLAKGEYIDSEEKGTEDRALEDTMGICC